jgi:MFS transporter, FHS family, L-fucose permease
MGNAISTFIAGLAPAELQAYRLQEAASVKLPYLGLALAILILAVLIAKSTLPALAIQRRDAAAGKDRSKHKDRERASTESCCR